jgi:hypothetical protein
MAVVVGEVVVVVVVVMVVVVVVCVCRVYVRGVETCVCVCVCAVVDVRVAWYACAPDMVSPPSASFSHRSHRKMSSKANDCAS